MQGWFQLYCGCFREDSSQWNTIEDMFIESTLCARPRENQSPSQDHHGRCYDFLSVLGQPWPFWVCSVLLSQPERGLSQYVLFVELYDLQIFAFLSSECGLNNDRLFWVAGRCLRDFVHSGCCVRCYEWSILERDGSGSFFNLRVTVKQWSLGFHQM